MDALPRPDRVTVEGALALTMDDGARLCLGVAGQGRPILCVHGWASQSAGFAPQADGLSEIAHVIRPDLRGHGRSDPTGPFTIDRLADDLAAIADRRDFRNAIAIGWSMGALALWRAFSRHPALAERFDAMVAIDMSPKVISAPGWSNGLDLDEAASNKMLDAMVRDWPAFVAGFAPRVFAPDAADALISAHSAAFAANDPQIMAAYWRSLAEVDARKDVAGCPVPLLVCYGEKSALYPAETAAWIAHNAPCAQAIGFAQSGHAPQLEHPEDFNRIIIELAGATDLAASPRRALTRISQAFGLPVGASGETEAKTDPL